MNIKLTPLFLFLILLFVLLMAGILGNRLYNMEEGFISYNEAQTPLQSQLTIPQYSTANSVYKLYDSIYFDSKNGNLLQLFGTPYNGSNVDTSGGSLTSINLLSRSGGDPKKFSISTANPSPSVDQSMIGTSLSNTNNKTNNYWIYPTPSNYNSGLPYQVFYILWNDKTYLHVFDIENTKNLSSFIFNSKGSPTFTSYTKSTVTVPTSIVNDTSPTKDSFNNQVFYDQSKNGFVYNITKNVFFDTTNANLIIQNQANDVSVYNGSVDSNNTPVSIFNNITSAGKINGTSSSISSSRTKSFLVNDLDGQTMVLYMPNQQTTMVVILSQDAGNSKLLSIKGVVRFNPNISGGIDFPGKTVTGPSTQQNQTIEQQNQTVEHVIKNVTKNVTENVTEKASSNDVISNYYNRYWNKNQCKDGKLSSEFLLKTQIVPPVCPACPSCPVNTTCTNCGGNGGSGTVGVSNVFDISGHPINTLYDANGKPITTLYDANGKLVHVVSNTGIINNYVDNAGQTIRSVAGGVTNTAGNVAMNAERVIGNVAKSTGTALGAVGSGVGNLVGKLIDNSQSQQGTPNGLGTPNSQGTPGLLTGDVQNNDGYAGRSYGGYGYPPNNTPNYNTTTYPYYGAVPSTSNNYMPITTSFSAFGK